MVYVFEVYIVFGLNLKFRLDANVFGRLSISKLSYYRNWNATRNELGEIRTDLEGTSKRCQTQHLLRQLQRFSTEEVVSTEQSFSIFLNKEMEPGRNCGRLCPPCV